MTAQLTAQSAAPLTVLLTALVVAACQSADTRLGPSSGDMLPAPTEAVTETAVPATSTRSVPTAPVTTPTRPAIYSGMGPGISVPDALAAPIGGALLVNGFLVVTGPEVTLCELLAESYPPQCGGARMEVQGLDVNAVPGLEAADETRWTPAPVQLLGEVREGVLYAQGLGKG